MAEVKKKSSLGVLAIAGVEPYQEKPGEEYMNEDQLAHFRKILEAWRRQLREEVDRTVTHMKDEAANFADPADRASQEEEFSLELRTRDRERKLIKKIEKTLQIIEEGEYGFCESCGIEIGIRRLEARPTAELCIDCKTLAEIREKQMAG
ncbi:RNA polymerase-binding protein DksA [Gallaecimonas mangrovi]|uniref:RNA polymerase-binding protein DksA n=1 Tax=Gallaecimonas mangrovi TaxID=2291597 RepID=UPI000E204FB2